LSSNRKKTFNESSCSYFSREGELLVGGLKKASKDTVA